MGISHADFFRSLPGALDGQKVMMSSNAVRIKEGKGVIELLLSAQTERTLGAMRLPTTMVEFKFRGLSREQVDRFMDRFELHFQRGGG